MFIRVLLAISLVASSTFAIAQDCKGSCAVKLQKCLSDAKKPDAKKNANECQAEHVLCTSRCR